MWVLMGLTTEFGRNVRQRRKAQGKTLEAFADTVGLSYSYLGELERGRVNPTLKVIERIATALSTDPLNLLKG